MAESASSVMCLSSSRRSKFRSSSILLAFSANSPLSDNRSSTAFFACSILPAAFILGPITNTTSVTLNIPFLPDSSIILSIPPLGFAFNCSIPKCTKTRFSPVSGTISHALEIATKSNKSCQV